MIVLVSTSLIQDREREVMADLRWRQALKAANEAKASTSMRVVPMSGWRRTAARVRAAQG